MIINFILQDFSTSMVFFSLSDPINSQGFKYYLYIDDTPISIQFDFSSEIQLLMQLPTCYLHLDV